MNKKNKGIGRITPYLYITPITLILLTFVVGSVVISICLSFTKYNIMTPPVFAGLRNYQKLLADAKFLKAFKNTFKMMAFVVPLQLILSLAISVFLVENRGRFLGKIANSVVFIPVLCSNAVVGVVWRELLNGKIPAVEKIFGIVGIDPAMLLGDAKTALITVSMVAVWKMVGYYVVIFSSGLLGISNSYYEASRVDGAGKVRNFFDITLPLLKPTIILAVFLSLTQSLQFYDLIANMTGGGPNNASTTLVVYAYSICFGSSSAGYAMAISDILFVVVLIVGILQRRYMHRDVSEI